MKKAAWLGAMCLVAGSLAWGQQGSKQSQEPPQEEPAPEQQAPPQERPTLGPAPAPTLGGGGGGGPRTATVNDIRKLMRIHTIYIERIDNALSDKLVEAIAKSGRFRIVTKAKEADGTLRGSCLESRRLKRVHSEVFISDRNGASVWQDNVYRPFSPPVLDQAVSDTAALVAAHLEESIQEAGRK